MRDHVKKSNGKPPRWRRMLGYHRMARTPRDPAAVMLQVSWLVILLAHCKEKERKEVKSLRLMAMLPRAS